MQISHALLLYRSYIYISTLLICLLRIARNIVGIEVSEMLSAADAHAVQPFLCEHRWAVIVICLPLSAYRPGGQLTADTRRMLL